MKKSKSKSKSKSLTEEVLKKLGNIFDALVVVPNQEAGPPPPFVQIESLWNMLENNWTRRQITNAIYYLKKQGYLVRQKESDQNKYFLSDKGVEKILRLKAKKQIFDKSKKFKNKYLIVLFDVPIQKNRERSILRDILRESKFEKLQQSVWITRFDVLKEVKTLVNFYKLEPYVKFMFVREAEKNI